MTDRITRYGPTALVTGASSGIGHAFAAVLAEQGFDLVLVARRLDLLDELATTLRAEHGVDVTVLQVDLARPDGAAQVLAATAALDVGLVVSNAGFSLPAGELQEADLAVMTEMVAVNSTASLLLAHGFVPRLRERGRGGIVFTSSVEGLLGSPYSAAYSATKTFVNGLAEALWGELSPEGIDVLALCPGATATERARANGVDPATNPNVQTTEEVARVTLDNIANGPTFIPSDHYRSVFDHFLTLPRREALSAMAQARKQAAQR